MPRSFLVKKTERVKCTPAIVLEDVQDSNPSKTPDRCLKEDTEGFNKQMNPETAPVGGITSEKCEREMESEVHMRASPLSPLPIYPFYGTNLLHEQQHQPLFSRESDFNSFKKSQVSTSPVIPPLMPYAALQPFAARLENGMYFYFTF